MLNLRLARGPLSREENEAILQDYNRLTFVTIPIEDFEHWVRDSPEGPAWHAILSTDEGRIVGHTSLLPMRTAFGGPELRVAKSEYSYTHEDFRSTPIRGFESMKRAKFLILVDQLFQHGVAQGWGPFFVSTAHANHPLSRRVGCKAVEFNGWECLLALRPIAAAHHTPNLTSKQRTFLLAAGIAQQIPWTVANALLPEPKRVRKVNLAEHEVVADASRLSFFEDRDSLQWRYLEGQYVRFSVEGSPEEYVIAKSGSPTKYLRILQWRVKSEKLIFQILRGMIWEARAQKAIGVRWAIYDDDGISQKLVRAMRRLGFICVRRKRTVMVHAKDTRFLAAEMWNMNDSLFSFDP